MTHDTARRHAPVLWALLGLFLLRVLGHALVAAGWAPFLPPMEEWFSGALAYPALLASQVAILVLFGRICLDFSRGRGFWAVPRRGLGTGLLVFGILYLAVMVIRYVLRMSLYPLERWTGGSIPIFFHWVLAAFVLVVGHYHRAQAPRAGRSRFPGWVRWSGAAAASAAAGLGLAGWVGYQVLPMRLAYELGARPAQYAVRRERYVPMEMADGVILKANVYHPQRLAKTPVVLVRLPLLRGLTYRLLADTVGRMWAERGYTVIMQATRGRYPSGGRYDPFRHERQDGMDTLAWIAQQPWFDGKVGMWGGSYFGYTQWVLGDLQDPGLSALNVQICSSEWYPMFYRGGAFSLASALFWGVWSGLELPKPPSRARLQPGYDGVPLIEADDRLGQDISFFNEWVSHPTRDAYWAMVDGERRAERLAAPILIMAGWQDPFLPVAINDFVRIRQGAAPEVAAGSRLIIGPWAHAKTAEDPGGPKLRSYRLESFVPSLPWFDRHLKGGMADPDEAPIRLYVQGAEQWREEREWPLARTRYVPYYLDSRGRANTAGGDGMLTMTLPEAAGEDTFIYDPAHPVPTAGGAMFGEAGGIERQNGLEQRADVLVYSTPALKQDVEVTGPIEVILHVSTTAPHTDFTGKLVDVHPDGAAYNVCEGILRQSYDGRVQPAEIRLELAPTSRVFLRAHRIRLEVSSSNYPRFDRNPNTGGDIPTERRLVPATQTVHHGPATPSRLVLPIIPAEPGS